MNNQVTDIILMIRPMAFCRNEQTVVNNYFQKSDLRESKSEIQNNALIEFEKLAELLDNKGIEVIIFKDNLNTPTPDSIFPNNWVSFHETGQIITYPMFAENRRLERRGDIIMQLSEVFDVGEVIRLESWENEGLYLEGTGGLVLDRQHNTCFIALSDRAHLQVIQNFQEITGYHAITFHANHSFKGTRVPIYHTNVMMYLGEAFSVVCLDSIDDPIEKENVVHTIESLEKEIIGISEEQLVNFAGNGLQLKNKSNDQFILMSTTAYKSFHQKQLKVLENYGEVIHSPLDTIEHYGGGSARCMIAEIFLSKQPND